MKRQIGLIVVAAGSALAVQRLARRYRQDLDAARARMEAVERKVRMTPFGAVEYAERGAGEPLLVSHGIFHGCDGGLLSVRDVAGDRRVIAPSRFGYLGSSMPPDATPADQADAFAALLDSLGIDRTDVIALSSGTTAALQFALRHPGRIKHLVVVSGNLPRGATAVAPPPSARLFYRDIPMWSIKAFVRPMLLRLMGVPSGFPRSAEDEAVVAEMADSIFPIAPRARGAVFDAFVSNPDVNDYRLQEIGVPTLIVHAKDDPLASYDAARRAAERIPGARLLSLETGGHLTLGAEDTLRTEFASFLAEPIGARS